MKGEFQPHRFPVLRGAYSLSRNCLGLCAGLGVSVVAVAQVTPDAGSLLNQIQRSFPAPRLPEVGPPPPPPRVVEVGGTDFPSAKQLSDHCNLKVTPPGGS